MRIASWNVNGIRAVAKKGYFDWLKKEDPDIICLQETKAFHHQLEPALKAPPGYTAIWHDGQKPGYSGTVIYSKIKPNKSKSHFEDIDHFHKEGRVTEAEFNDFILINIYLPNGNPRANGEERLAYKLEFYDYLMTYTDELKKRQKKILLLGDFNVAHTEIDIARPKANKNSIGFLPVERDKLSDLLNHGFIDTFRRFNPDLKDAYTWWSYRAASRPRNVGWRIDYILASKELFPHVRSIIHQTDVMGSDHCPLIIELDI